jgi:hypothetical protein
MKTFKVREGGRLNLQVQTDSDDAVSATLILRSEEGTVYELPDQPFIDKVADFQDITEIADLLVGEYDMQINENYDEGLPSKFPNPDQCDGDECEFLTLVICDAIDVEGESS